MKIIGVVAFVVVMLVAPAGAASAVVGGGIAGPAPNGASLDFVGRLLVKGNFNCTATLIGRESVMTAAHCLRSAQSQEDLSVQFGSTDLINDPRVSEARVIDVVVSDRSYGVPGLSDEVVVLRLDHPILDVAPARVARRDDGEWWAQGRDVYGLGWGLIYEGRWAPSWDERNWRAREDTILSAELRTAELRVVDTNTIVSRGLLKVFPNGPARMAHGDSGGPLVTADNFGPLVIGVLSGGLGDGNYYMKTGVDPLFVREISQGNLSHPEEDPNIDVLYGPR